jgi:putative endonuclease
MAGTPSGFSRQMLGSFGENLVADYLLSRGALILDRNWRIKEGEIDLVAKMPDGVIAIVEVKTRSSLSFGHPLEAIDNRKSHRLQRLALAWLVTHGHFGKSFQIDCAAVLIDRYGRHSIDYRSDIL